jgi:hypothetical protein
LLFDDFSGASVGSVALRIDYGLLMIDYFGCWMLEGSHPQALLWAATGLD